MSRVEQVLREIRSLKDEILGLDSFAPGMGYDRIGFSLTRLIYGDFDAAEKREILSTLSPEEKSVIQRASILSEIEMDRSVVSKSLAKPEVVLDLAGMDKNEERDARIAAFRSAISDYPYNWGFAKAEGELALIKAAGYRPEPHDSVFINYGRSMLPLSGLSMHFLSGLPLIWIDPFEDTRAPAAAFISKLERMNILEEGAVKIVSGAGGLNQILPRDKKIYLYISDKDYDHRAFLKEIHDFGVDTVLVSEVDGMAELMYPKLARGALAGLYNLKAMVVPVHAQDDIAEEAEIIVKNPSKDVFGTTLLFARPS